MDERDYACYVYAIARPRNDRPMRPLPVVGIGPKFPSGGQSPICALAYRDLRALYSCVPLSEFGPAALESHLADTDWTLALVLAHQKVLGALLDDYTLVPLRFCSLYSRESQVQAVLAQHAESFARTLDRLQGTLEWGVKVYCDRRWLIESLAANSPSFQAQREQIAQIAPGAAYFLRKKLEQAAQREAAQLAAACAHDSHGRLAACAREAVVNPPQLAEMHRRRAEMILNGAYLIDERSAETFRATCSALAAAYPEQGFEYELTGPWPPYNFANVTLVETSHEHSPGR